MLPCFVAIAKHASVHVCVCVCVCVCMCVCVCVCVCLCVCAFYILQKHNIYARNLTEHASKHLTAFLIGAQFFSHYDISQTHNAMLSDIA